MHSMAEIFKTPLEIVNEMLEDLEAITGVALSATDFSREEVIKMWTQAGAISMARARIRRTYDDFFPQSASEEALEKHLAARQLPDRSQAQKSTGVIRHTGTDGVSIGIGTQVRRRSDGSVFQAITAGVVASGVLDLTYESVSTGANQNLDVTGQVFDMITVIAGVDSTATNQTFFLSGRDLETAAEMLERIEAHDRNDDSGGNLVAYETWAREASPQVVRAKSIKHPRGVGTVDTIITSGTTDIETAVRNGDAVTRLPSNTLIDLVQAYILEKNPTTDDHETVAPTEVALNVTIAFDLYDEALRPSVETEIEILTKVFLYEAQPSEVLHPTELERRIDRRVGHLIEARRVSDFSGGGPTYTVPSDKLLIPGTITQTTM